MGENKQNKKQNKQPPTPHPHTHTQLTKLGGEDTNLYTSFYTQQLAEDECDTAFCMWCVYLRAGRLPLTVKH